MPGREPRRLTVPLSIVGADDVLIISAAVCLSEALEQFRRQSFPELSPWRATRATPWNWSPDCQPGARRHFSRLGCGYYGYTFKV
jgi:hypothetical protein